MVIRQYDKDKIMSQTHTMLIEEGHYAARVQYREFDDGSGFGPFVEKEDAFKMDRVRLALRRGNFVAAAKEAEIYELRRVAAE
jgi:hypothetical protein